MRVGIAQLKPKLLAAGAVAACAGVLPVADAGAGGGGATYVREPVLRSVACMSECASRSRPRVGSMVRLTGRHLRPVTFVVFHGGRGTGDDARIPVRPRSDRSVALRVPAAARSGPVSAWVGDDVRSNRSRPVPVMPPPPPEVNVQLSPAPGPREPGAPQLETGTSSGRLFFDQARPIKFSFRANEPVNVRVELVRPADGVVVHTWTPPALQPGVTGSVTWNGVTPAGIQPQGRYAFRLVAAGASGRTAQSSAAGDVTRDAFDFLRHIFPVRGSHDYGGEGARFGSGRDGHSHQGHDVFARCGTRLVAARGGVVKFRQYHAAAGHYLVIDGAETDVDYVYMHMTDAPTHGPGDRVRTGERLGTVGDSGNARGCHLHFEMWGAPGWYDGGAAFDPLPHLREWDANS